MKGAIMNPIIVMLILMVESAISLRIAMLNDIHLNQTYDYTCGFPFCYDQGIYDFDSPSALLDTILDDISEVFSMPNNLDAILVSGDFVMHGLSSSVGGTSNWSEMKTVMTAVMDQIEAKFPGVPIICSIGNNDVVYHYQAPSTTDKTTYYADLFDIWFTNVDKNSQYSDIASVETSFTSGGYYSYDISTDLTIISLNSVYFNSDNTNDITEATTQLTWLQSQLSSASSDRKFILQMHIPPGLFYYQGVEQFWYDTYLDAYLQILNTYQSKILFIIGAHIHQADIRAPISDTYPDLSLTVFLTPSVSPIYMNNPGYSIIDFSTSEGVEHVFWRFFQLYEYSITHLQYFITVDPEDLYNIKFNDPTSVREFIEKMQSNSYLFAKYMASKLGYNWLYQQLGGMGYTMVKSFVMPELQQNFLCAMQYYDLTKYNECI